MISLKDLKFKVKNVILFLIQIIFKTANTHIDNSTREIVSYTASLNCVICISLLLIMRKSDYKIVVNFKIKQLFKLLLEYMVSMYLLFIFTCLR